MGAYYHISRYIYTIYDIRYTTKSSATIRSLNESREYEQGVRVQLYNTCTVLFHAMIIFGVFFLQRWRSTCSAIHSLNKSYLYWHAGATGQKRATTWRDNSVEISLHDPSSYCSIKDDFWWFLPPNWKTFSVLWRPATFFRPIKGGLYRFYPLGMILFWSPSEGILAYLLCSSVHAV